MQADGLRGTVSLTVTVKSRKRRKVVDSDQGKGNEIVLVSLEHLSRISVVLVVDEGWTNLPEHYSSNRVVNASGRG